MIELIALGGWIFWTILGLAFLLEFISVGNEKAWPTITIPIVLAVVMGVFSSFNVLTYCRDNWVNILIGIGVYIVVACLWALFKWYRRCLRRGNVYAACLEKWAEQNLPNDVKITSINDIPWNKRVSFFLSLRDAFRYGHEDESYGRESWGSINISDPHTYRNEGAIDFESRSKQEIETLQVQVLKKVLSSPKENKERIMVWMIAWPFSMLTTLVFDFLYDFFNWLRKSLAGIFVEISRMAFGKYRKDFDTIKVEKEI
jgi:hypothetical protein